MMAARSTIQRASRVLLNNPAAVVGASPSSAASSASSTSRSYATPAASALHRHAAPLITSPLSSFSPQQQQQRRRRREVQCHPFHTSSPRSMFIQTETTPNEDSLKFLPGQKVMTSGTAEFLDSRDSMRSPLAKALFRLEGVRSVFFGPDFVTVSKVNETRWGTLKPEIYSTLMEHFTAQRPLFTDEAAEHGSSDTTILDTDSETVAMIKELLDTRVRPAIQEDGGDLEFRGFGEDTDGLVRVKLKGSCRGCDSSTVTLKSGIERMLMHYIPEVKGVEQVLDVEEEVALDEFAKLEQKLHRDRDSERKRETSMGFSV